AWYVHERLFVQHRILRQHPVEVGTKPVGQVIGLDRPAEPPRMEATGNSVAVLDPCHAFADSSDLARRVGKRDHAELRRTATATFEDHQIPIVERARAYAHQDLLRPGPGVLA